MNPFKVIINTILFCCIVAVVYSTIPIPIPITIAIAIAIAMAMAIAIVISIPTLDSSIGKQTHQQKKEKHSMALYLNIYFTCNNNNNYHDDNDDNHDNHDNDHHKSVGVAVFDSSRSRAY